MTDIDTTEAAMTEPEKHQPSRGNVCMTCKENWPCSYQRGFEAGTQHGRWEAASDLDLLNRGAYRMEPVPAEAVPT